MKALLVGIGLAVTVLVALVTTMSSAGVHAQQNVCQPNPSPVDPADPSVIVASPAANDSVTSPVHVAGQARVFEANVSLTLFDASGAELVSTFTTAAEGQTLSPFSTDVTFSVTSSTPACLWVFETSAQDGSPVNVVQVPLTLLPPGLPATGAAAQTASSSLPWWLAAGLGIAGAGLLGGGWLMRHRGTSRRA